MLSPLSLILFLLLSLIAEILGTIGGFGSSLFFVPIGNFFFDFKSVLGITALFHLTSNLSKIALFRKGIDKRLAIRMGIPAIVFVILGAYASKFFEKEILEMALAVFLIAISALFLLMKHLVIQANDPNTIAGGALSGFLAGILGTGGAIRGMVLIGFNLEKNIFIATSAVIDLGIDLSRSVVYFFNGYIHKHDLYLIPLLVIVSFAGTYIGKRIIQYIPQEKFRAIVLILIGAIGLITLIRSLVA
jgi:uncharacterized membrane protein YfcA